MLMAVLLLFGSKKIPEFAKGLGKGIRQFKDAAGDLQKDINNSIHDVKRSVEEEREKIEKK